MVDVYLWEDEGEFVTTTDEYGMGEHVRRLKKGCYDGITFAGIKTCVCTSLIVLLRRSHACRHHTGTARLSGAFDDGLGKDAVTGVLSCE